MKSNDYYFSDNIRQFVLAGIVALIALAWWGIAAQAAAGQQSAPTEPVHAAAVGTTFNVTSTSCTGPGSYVIGEDETPGYRLTDIRCVDSATGKVFKGNTDRRSVDLNLVAGETVHCTFTNTKLGTVIIKKGTAPSGGTGFGFGGSLGDFTLDDGGSKSAPNLAPGAYTVTEDSHANYELSGFTCVDGDPNGQTSTGDVAKRTANIQLDPGETVTCSFTNVEDDTITVEKVTIPPSDTSFGFGGTLGAFTLKGGEVKNFTQVTPDEYIISEDSPMAAGYELTEISCVDSGTGQVFAGDLTTRSVKLKLVAGEKVHCTFSNTKSAKAIEDLFLPMVSNE